MEKSKHWDDIYAQKALNEVSWYRRHLETSLEWIRFTGLSTDAQIIDVGGGASTLVDDLVALHYRNVSVLDISRVALDEAKQRLGGDSAKVQWIEGDITSVKLPPGHYDLWHDRAVFHFLTKVEDRMAYLKTATQSIKSGGFLIVATFALEGPLTCSGLFVDRYSRNSLAAQFPGFEVLQSRDENHQTPSGATQKFVYLLMKRG